MSISLSEIMLVLLVAVLVIKPEQLPETAQLLGRSLRWLRHTTTKFKQEIVAPLTKLDSEKRDE